MNNTQETVVVRQGRADPVTQVIEVAESVQKTGPDPVLIGTVVVVMMLVVGTIIYMIRRFMTSQERTIEHFRARSADEQREFTEQLSVQRGEFRQELRGQREVHVSELTRLSSTFESSLERITRTHQEGMEKLASRVEGIGARVEKIEGYMIGQPLSVNTTLQAPPGGSVEITTQPARPTRRRRKGEA